MTLPAREELLGQLRAIPRAELAVVPTPLLEAANLERRLAPEGHSVFLKMDAWTGMGLGGNKVRKLEYVLAPERLEGIDTLITSGSAQSNHARVTAAAGARLGLRTVLVLSGDPGEPPRGNAFLHRLLGAEIRRVAAPDEREDAVERAAEDIRREGGTPLVVGLGASTPRGVLGYVRAAAELDAQLEARGLWTGRPLWLVTPASSCGTVAGLALGFTLLGRDDLRILAVSADVPAAEIDETVARLAAGSGKIIGREGHVREGLLVPDDTFVGDGYGIPTEASRAAVRRLAELEGVILDPTYTSKAAAGLLDALESGRFQGSSAVVFLHTGGHPALLA